MYLYEAITIRGAVVCRLEISDLAKEKKKDATKLKDPAI
jgi:hypothetical protein